MRDSKEKPQGTNSCSPIHLRDDVSGFWYDVKDTRDKKNIAPYGHGVIAVGSDEVVTNFLKRCVGRGL
jgi:hypothetical protein